MFLTVVVVMMLAAERKFFTLSYKTPIQNGMTDFFNIKSATDTAVFKKKYSCFIRYTCVIRRILPVILSVVFTSAVAYVVLLID